MFIGIGIETIVKMEEPYDEDATRLRTQICKGYSEETDAHQSTLRTLGTKAHRTTRVDIIDTTLIDASVQPGTMRFSATYNGCSDSIPNL